MNHTDFAANAERIVREAAKLARDAFGRASIVREKEFHDIVTDADLAVERYIIRAISELYPEHGFYSEEEERRDSENEYIWILDPIDGTKYYSRSVPLYAISLALARRGQLVLGIVYSPEADQMFQAIVGQGAMLNGTSVKCSRVTRLEDAIVCVEIPSSDSEHAALLSALDCLHELVPRIRRMRILGVSALGLCYCAIGGFDAYLNLGSGSQYYDFAAGEVIVKEAGARFRYDRGRIIAGPGELFDQLASLIDRR